MTRLVVLLDDGGVLNDNALRGAQWQRLVPEFFVPILGGTPEAWVDANRVVFERLYAANVWQGLSGAPGDFARFERRYYEVWLGDMCELMGLPRPPEQQCFELGVAAERHHPAHPRSLPRRRRGDSYAACHGLRATYCFRGVVGHVGGIPRTVGRA